MHDELPEDDFLVFLQKRKEEATSAETSIPPYSKLRGELLEQRRKKQEALELKIKTLSTDIFAQLSSLMKKDPTEFFDEDHCVLKYEVVIPGQEEWLSDDAETQLLETLIKKLETRGYFDCEVSSLYQKDLLKVKIAIQVSFEEEEQ